MRFGSVCSGIEAASVAWAPLGWEAAWFSEIEPFPCAVLAHHYPDVPNLGDMITLPDRIRAGVVEAPDIFCGGTPCQAFSVAGQRKSLDDARGNLSLTFCEIADAINEQRTEPAIIFWENVPGVLNTKDNAFGCFLGELAGESSAIEPPRGKWTNAGCVYGPKRTVAWRILDAQYFGVAQQRRRVFVVASARDGFDPCSVLFEFDGLRRDTAPSRETRKEIAGAARTSLIGGFDYENNAHGLDDVTGPLLKGSPTGGGRPLPAIAFAQNTRDEVRLVGGDGSIVGALAAQAGMKQTSYVAQPTVLMDQGGSVMNVMQDGTVGKLRRETHGHEPIIAQPIGFTRCDYGNDAVVDGTPTMRCGSNYSAHLAAAIPNMEPMPINTMVALRHNALGRGTGFGIGDEGDPAYTITKGHSHAVAQPVAYGVGESPDTAHCLRSGASKADKHESTTYVAQPIAFDLVQITSKVNRSRAEPGLPAGTISKSSDMHVAQPVVAPSLTASNDPSRSPQSSEVTQQVAAVHAASMVVRRLTPIECERLQGFPDNYTNIPWRKKPAGDCPDGPRYKALGNSWAVPVVRWIGWRIALNLL